jgi:hypothetical protein
MLLFVVAARAAMARAIRLILVRAWAGLLSVSALFAALRPTTIQLPG